MYSLAAHPKRKEKPLSVFHSNCLNPLDEQEILCRGTVLTL
jgi:hypothetical protein